MNKSRIAIPEDLLKAAEYAAVNSKWTDLSGSSWIPDGRSFAKEVLEAAFEHLSKHPIRPTNEQAEIVHNVSRDSTGLYKLEAQLMCEMWQRIMFLSPEPLDTESEALDGMFFAEQDISFYLKGDLDAKQLSDHLNAYIRQAYRIGKGTL